MIPDEWKNFYFKNDYLSKKNLKVTEKISQGDAGTY